MSGRKITAEEVKVNLGLIISRLRKVLVDVEFSGRNRCCPYCGEFEYHHDRCKLSKALADSSGYEDKEEVHDGCEKSSI